jgi:hypothetical protein
MSAMKLTVRVLLLSPVLVAGCAGDGVSAPSLKPRAVETKQTTSRPVAPAPLQPADAALINLINTLVASANEGNNAFQNAVGPGTPVILAGRSAPRGSEAWIAAQLRLSQLEAARAKTTLALGDIDTLLIKRVETGGNGIAELRATQVQVAAMADAQTRALDTLRVK